MSDQKEKTITISTEEYRRLQGAVCELEALEHMGVDNWCGYGDAQCAWIKDRSEEDGVEYDDIDEYVDIVFSDDKI